MTRALRCVATAIAILAVPSVAAAQTCRYENLSVDFADVSFVAPPPGFDLCVSLPYVGTLRGTLQSCVRFADLVPSDAVWHDGNDGAVAGWWYDELRTPEGTVTIVERGMMDGATGMQATMMWVSGGSGAYAGATGLLTVAPAWPKRTSGFVIQGQLCTP